MPRCQLVKRQQFVCLIRSVLRVRRHHVRPWLAIICVPLLVTFILKVTYSRDTRSKARLPATDLSLPSGADVDSSVGAEVDSSVAGRHFAQLGVGLVKPVHTQDGDHQQSRAPGQENWWFRQQEDHIASGNSSLVAPLPSLVAPLPSLVAPLPSPDKDQNNPLPVGNFSPTAGSGRPSLSPLQAIYTLTTTAGALSQSFLAVLVISRPSNVRLRQAARQTWGQSSRQLGVELRFVVGRQENWDDIVDRESGMHNDVIIVEEEDTYEKLPSKVLTGFSRVLGGARYIMKIDDDTIVNLPYLLQELNSGALKSTQIMGAICINSTVIRDPTDKWAVSWLDYPFSTYPPYAFGGGYVMSAGAAASVLKASARSTEWIHLEDVYVTGILAMKCHLSHVTQPGFSYWITNKASACDFVLNKRMTSVNHSEKEFYRLYSETQFLLRSRNTRVCTHQQTRSSSD